MKSGDEVFIPAKSGDQLPASAPAATHQIQQLRGWGIGAFAQIEFMLAYLVQRSAIKWPEYAEFARPMPYNAETRVKRVNEMLKVTGPLSEYSQTIGRITADFEHFYDLRHTLAHGFTTVIHAENGYFLQTRRYKPSKKRDWDCVLSTTSMADFEAEVDRAVAFSHEAMGFFADLFLHYELE